MMTSSNGSIFRITGPLCGEFTGPGEFPTQRPVTRSFDVFFDLRLNKRLSKQPWGWWSETPSSSLWRHRNGFWTDVTLSIPFLIWNLNKIFRKQKWIVSFGLNSLRHSLAIWRHRTWSTLVQAMVCCLTVPNHYLNQCWLILTEVLWHTHEGNVTGNVQEIFQSLKITNLRLQPHLPVANELTRELLWYLARSGYHTEKMTR